MITASLAVFPNNVVELIAARMALLDSDLRVFKRPLRDSDPAQSVGVFGQQWTPENDSLEIGKPVGRSEPTIGTYRVMVQAFVKDFDEVRGLATHSVLSKMIRTMLYRDEPLRVSLRSLSVEMMGSIERSQRFGVSNVQYISNELNGDFLYLSILEFWIDTETV